MTHVTGDIIFRTIFSRAADARRGDPDLPRLRPRAGDSEPPGRVGAARRAEVPAVRQAARRAACARDPQPARRERAGPAEEAGAATENGGRKDILDSLLAAVDPETGDRFSRSELVDQLALVFMAGHETSASALAWALYLIAKRPDIQERMHREAVAAFADRQPEYSPTSAG